MELLLATQVIDLQHYNKSNASNVMKGINYNIVNITGSNVGVRINAATKYNILDNTITFANQNAVNGISVTGSADCILSCNDVSGTGTGGSTNAAYTGNCSYSIAQTTGTTYKCNTSSDVRTGFRFSGDCGSSANFAPEFRGNTLGSPSTAHRRGLWMTNTASFGAIGLENEQIHKGNQWYGSFTGTRAIHQGNPFLVTLSKFTIHTTALPWYPQGLQANGLWFTVATGSPNPCNTDAECPIYSIREGDNIGNFGRRIARNQLDSLPGVYAQGLRWELRRSLYRKIEDKPAIATQDTVAAAFYQANQGTPLGKLTQVEQELGTHTQMAANTITAVLNNGSSIRAKLDSLAILERTLPASPTLAQLSGVAIQKQAVAGRISTLIATQHTLLDPINQDINNAASTWVASNNAISITAVQEENRRKVNMIALNRVVKGQANFTGIELGTLRDVAGQCPITGGNAVYEARSILAYNGEIPAYDDNVLCDSAALAQERYLAPPVGDVRETQGYQLVAVPNPANDYLTIAYSAPVESAVMAMQLFNPIGVMVVALPLNGMQGTQELEMSTLPAGLYYLRFIADGRLISVQKIVVVH